jgi:hypothetical protein
MFPATPQDRERDVRVREALHPSCESANYSTRARVPALGFEPRSAPAHKSMRFVCFPGQGTSRVTTASTCFACSAAHSPVPDGDAVAAVPLDLLATKRGVSLAALPLTPQGGSPATARSRHASGRGERQADRQEPTRPAPIAVHAGPRPAFHRLTSWLLHPVFHPSVHGDRAHTSSRSRAGISAH